MSRDPRYDILFEPVRIGPVTTKNRFYQVPHCSGMGYRDPSANAAMRGIKAEGGWGVVCPEQTEIHYSSEITPFIETRIWDDRDLPALERVTQAVHAHGALCGIELVYSGTNGPNFYSREVPMGPTDQPVATFTYDPVQARAMDKQDIANLRRWHRDAAIRAKRAEFDIVYVFVGSYLSVLCYFLSRRYNHRTDEYGGSLENRVRLIREILEDTRDAVGDRSAVAIRLSVDELLGPGGIHKSEAEDAIGLLAEYPDLWDLNLSGWENDSLTSRFAQEGYQEPFVHGIKRLTTKPVVGVGRFTSPDLMVKQVKSGVLDLIGGARPSIADPFLPKKIEEGRIDEIRECIGCNICVSSDFTMSPLRCTQNPSMGEEWRRGWHPERIRAKQSDRKVLIVGSGPSGLEAAMMLGRRGYDVALAEAGRELGGRVARESRLPGLSAWGRVRDYREGRLKTMPNVEIYFDSALTAEDVLGFGIEHIGLATGSLWRRDGVGRHHTAPMPIDPGCEILTPDDLMAGQRPTRGKQIAVFDDDHYYMGGVVAELLAREGFSVTLVTPAAEPSTWTRNTLEQANIQKRLIEADVTLLTTRLPERIAPGVVHHACLFTGRVLELAADAVVMVTSRLPVSTLRDGLLSQRQAWADAGITSVTAFGDALAPATIAHAVHAGRRYAEDLDAAPTGDAMPFRREVTALWPETPAE